MPEHLLLPSFRQLPSRRAGGAGGGTPSRQPGQHGTHLSQQLAGARAPRQLNAGVDPDLVFKIKAGSRPEDSSFEGRGLEVLGETVDYTYFVLASDDGAGLDVAIQRYMQTGELRSFFNQIDDIEPYGPADRMGPGVAELISSHALSVIVDISLWPSGTLREAQRRAGVVEAVVTGNGGEVLLRSVSARRNYLRVSLGLPGLADLLAVSVIELVRVESPIVV